MISIPKYLRILILTCVMIFLFHGINIYFPRLESVDTNNLAKVAEIKSPSGKYTLSTYLTEGVLFSSDYSYIGELDFNNHSNKSRMAFWVSGSDENIPRWIDEETINVGKIRLNMLEDHYDFRYHFN